MRVLLALALVAVSATFAIQFDGKTMQLHHLIQSRIYEDKINETLEGMKETLINGDPENGIPSFAPLEIAELYLNLSEANLINTDMHLNDVVVAGVPDFTITHLKVSVVGFAIEFGVLFDHLSIHTKYDGSAEILGFIPVYGTGELDIQLPQLQLDGSFKLGTTDGFVSIDDFTVSIAMGHFTFNASGLLNDPDGSLLLSALLTDVVNDIIHHRGPWVTKTFSPIISSFLNSLVEGMTVDDLLGMLTGGGEAETPLKLRMF